MSVRRVGKIRWLAALLLPVALIAGTMSLAASVAQADNTMISSNTLRSGWDQNEPQLAPAAVASSNFGQLFSTPVDGQVYAQPLVLGSTVIAATENNNVYGINKITGAKIWSRNLGPVWPAAAIGCGDLVPNIGVTSTPVYDPATNAIYLTTKVNDGPDTAHPHWYMHALNPSTGAERPGWPVVIQGTPTNNAGHPFDPFSAAQRPGLLVLGGVVYAGFASHCDYGSFTGSVVGVKTSGVMSTIWSTVSNNPNGWSGIWQGGGGLVSDGPGRIIVATGNGLGNSVTPNPGPGNVPQPTYSESVIRLQVGPTGSLSVGDFFSPANNRALDRDDVDLGSGGPMGLPDGFGTAAHPHLLVQIGKDGRLFLLDRDNLGGMGQGPGGTDAVVGQSGPYQGVWGHPAFWGGDGGYVYLVTNSGPLRAFQVTTNTAGTPVLVASGNTTDNWGYTSGSPVVTSSGSTSGSALVWAIWSSGPSGTGAQLRAYDAVPAGGTMKLRYSAPIGIASKFATPATDAGRVYVGTRDGHLIGFGSPAATALTGSPVNFGSVAVGATAKATLTLTATKALTVSAAAATAPFAASIAAPIAVAAGSTVSIPVTFTPTTPGGSAGTVTVTTNLGAVAFGSTGTGTRAGLGASPSSLAFGPVALGAGRTLSVNITNTGTTAATVVSSRAPGGPFGVVLPANGTVIPAGGSVASSVVYKPTTAGAQSGSFTITGSTGAVTVNLTGTGTSGAAKLTLTPASLDWGTMLVGTTISRSFTVSNTGNVQLTVSKAAPPTAPFQVSSPFPEGTTLAAGQTVLQKVTLQPGYGLITGSYAFGSNDGTGAKSVALAAVGASVANFVSPAARKCIDVKAGSNVDKTPITIYDCNGSAAQDWTNGANGSLRALGRCMDTANGGTANGTVVQLYTCNGSAAQTWKVGTTGTITNPTSGRCLTPDGSGVTNGVPLVLKDCDGSAQVWTSPQRTGSLVGPTSGRCLDVQMSGTADGTLTQLYDCNQSAAQSWTLARGGTVQAFGRCLDVQYAAKTSGTPVWLWTCNGTPAQQWDLLPSGALLNPNSGLCLGPATGTANGTLMKLTACTADPARNWQLD